jgi:hypothetical protein
MHMFSYRGKPVRKYAHLSTTHLAEYVDRASGLKLVASGGVVTNQLRGQK